MEAAAPRLVDGVDVGAVLDERLDGGDVSLGAGAQQRRHPLVVPRLDVGLANLQAIIYLRVGEDTFKKYLR